MDELIDLVDEFGNLTGEVCMKSKAHRLGLWHLCVDIWLYTDSGEIVIQKRVANKDVFPNLWDVSVAGHVGAGESPLNAAYRELEEELGLNIPLENLNFIGNSKSSHKQNEQLTDKEFHHIYIARFNGSIDNLILQTEEVSEIRLVSINELKNKLLDTKFKEEFVPYSDMYFSMVFKAIEFVI